MRRLYKYVRSEHIGGDTSVELYLHYAHFELRAGKGEKCAAILEAAGKITTLASAEPLRRATVELKLLGGFRLDPIIDQQPLQPISVAGGLLLPKQSMDSTTITQQQPPEYAANPPAVMLPPPPPKFVPPPTPHAQEATLGPSVKMTPVPLAGNGLGLPSPMDESATKRAMLPDPMTMLPSSGIKASEEQRAALSHRIRRLGLGPPKRAVVTSAAISANASPAVDVGTNNASPNDSTVPRTALRSPLPLVDASERDTDSPLNSPTKSNPNVAAMLIDRDDEEGAEQAEQLNAGHNMSMTTVSKRAGTFYPLTPNSPHHSPSRSVQCIVSPPQPAKRVRSHCPLHRPRGSRRRL